MSASPPVEELRKLAAFKTAYEQDAAAVAKCVRRFPSVEPQS